MAPKAPDGSPEEPASDTGARCRWCGKTYAEHADAPSLAVPRMPCAGLKSGFLARAPEPSATPSTAPLPRPYPAAPSIPWVNSRTDPEHALSLRRTLLLHVILPALNYLAFPAPASRTLAEYRRAECQLLMGTNAIESPNFDRHQLGGGPAVGIFQMEAGRPERAYDDILHSYLAYRPKLNALLAPHSIDRLAHDDVYAACMARIQYRRSPLPIPAADGIAAMDSVYLRAYNRGGASRPGEFTEAYHRLVAPLF